MQLVLSAELFNACRAILLECDEFESDLVLNDFFNTPPLDNFLGAVPDRGTTEQRVQAVMAVFRTLSFQGVPVVALILDALRDARVQGDDLRAELDDMAQRVRGAVTAGASGGAPAVVNPAAAAPPAVAPTVNPAPPAASALEVHLANQLYANLVAIDFKAQSALFTQTLRQRRIGAFIIHGRSHLYGQDDLAGRFQIDWSADAQFRFRDHEKRPIIIDFDSVSTTSGLTLDTIWTKLSEGFQLVTNPASNQDKWQQLIDTIAEAWKTQHIVIILKNVNTLTTSLPPADLQTLLQRFWVPLATQLGPALWPPQNNSASTRLLLFLIDNTGLMPQLLGVQQADQPDDPHFPVAPLRLPPLDQITRDDLSNWLVQPGVATLLQTDDIRPAIPFTADDLFSASQGVPASVFGIIWNRCNLKGKWSEHNKMIP